MYTYTLFAHAVLRILERHKNCIKADKAYSFLLNVMPLLEKNVTILGLGNLSHTKATALQFINSFVALVVCAIQRLGLTPLPVILKGSPKVTCSLPFGHTITQKTTQSIVQFTGSGSVFITTIQSKPVFR